MTWPQYIRGECRVDRKVVRLSRQMTELLATLLLRYPRMVPVADLIDAIHPDPDGEPENAKGVVYCQLHRLRQRIGHQFISILPQYGYRLEQSHTT